MRKIASWIAFSLVILFQIISGLAREPGQPPSAAPVSEEFLKWQTQPSLLQRSRFAEDGHPLGLAPSPHDISHLKLGSSAALSSRADLLDLPDYVFEAGSEFKNRQITRMSAASLPAACDLRSRNKLTAARNQGSCGSCWAFATLASLESYLMPSENWDFSEQNLIDEHGYDNGPCDGGQIYMSTAYLTRWSGPISEEDAPFIYLSAGAAGPAKKHVQDIIYLPPRNDASDNDLIKSSVMSYGAVYATMYYKSAFYAPDHCAYYNNGTREGAHAVAIVGWNDNFDKNKFSVTPAGNGAFIAKNSWGAEWGEDGYFYISYYDRYFATEDVSAVVRAEPLNLHEVIYQYDPLGWVNSLGYGTETGWFANIFAASSDASLTAVGLYSASASGAYGIYVYTDVVGGQPRSGALAGSQTGNLDSPGYFTIPLDKAIPLATNQAFSVVVKLSTAGYAYPIPCEQPQRAYTSRAVANAGESYVSEDGETWNDLHTSWEGKFRNTNVCLKAYAGGPNSYGDYPALFPPSAFQVQRLENDFIFFKEYINRLTWQANPENDDLVTAYRIYRKAQGAAAGTRQLISEVAHSVFMHDDRGLARGDLYSYQLTAVDGYGRESEPAAAGN